eukprot:1158603-Pelagomonas_calceolata.AAC.3
MALAIEDSDGHFTLWELSSIWTCITLRCYEVKTRGHNLDHPPAPMPPKPMGAPANVRATSTVRIF